MIFLWFKPIRSNTLKYGRINFLLNESSVLWHVSLGLHYGGGSGGGGGGLTISYRHQKFWALCPWCITVRYKTPVLQTMTRSKIIWWQFVVSLFIENLYVFMDFIVESTHVQNQMFIVESNMRQHFYLEWLLWVLSTNLCILETLNFLNWGILLSSYYQLPNMYCIRMRKESAVFKFIYREFSTKWHTCIYCDSICHSFNENLDWNTNCKTFIYNIKPRTTSNKHLFLSVLSIYLLCSVWFSMLCRLREIQCSMSDKLFAVDFLLASLCY